MKALGSRFSFYAGFVVGTFTLYVFLRQVWFERSVPAQQATSPDRPHEQAEEDQVWKKERSALFNLNHPHHTGASTTLHDALCVQKNNKKR